jgi:hypothetical protein
MNSLVFWPQGRPGRQVEPSHGFCNGTPVAAKSATFRVTTIMPWTSAVAAIKALRQNALIAWPKFDA